MTLRPDILFPILAAVLTGMAATSCSSDSAEPNGPDIEQGAAAGNVTLRISAAAFAADRLTTRATANFTDPELTETTVSANELIRYWTVAFIGNDGSIAALAQGNPGTGGTSGAAGVWTDLIKVELPRGTYTAIAIANLDQEAVKTHLEELDFSSPDWKDHIYEMAVLRPKDNSLIPMSGYLEDITVRGTVNEEFAIEVVRMKAKIEYAIKNLSSEQIDVQSFSITPAYMGDIYLFPDYAHKPVPDTQSPAYEPRYPSLAEGASPYETLTVSAPTGFILPANDPNTVKRGNFYINESIATGNHPTDHFHIGLTLKRGDAEAEDVTYALADEALKFICRNDYILFPITITDYVPEFEVIDFPPIGGYPVTVEPVNNEFYATFSNSGAFDISARLRDSRGRTVAIRPYDGTDTQSEYVRYLGSVDPDGNIDPEGFRLTYDPALSAWQGTFPPISGANRHITLKFEFKTGSLIYTRTLHLISK